MSITDKRILCSLFLLGMIFILLAVIETILLSLPDNCFEDKSLEIPYIMGGIGLILGLMAYGLPDKLIRNN